MSRYLTQCVKWDVSDSMVHHKAVVEPEEEWRGRPWSYLPLYFVLLSSHSVIFSVSALHNRCPSNTLLTITFFLTLGCGQKKLVIVIYNVHKHNLSALYTTNRQMNHPISSHQYQFAIATSLDSSLWGINIQCVFLTLTNEVVK